MPEVLPRIDDEVAGSVRAGSILAEPVQIGPSAENLQNEIEAITSMLILAHQGKKPGEIPGLQPARELYRAFGVDPTKTRPSSEAMLRRLLKGKPFPLISNAVDVCNLCALRFMLSLGLYDADKIEGQVTLRRGWAGESFEGIRKGPVHVEGRLVLADDQGAFGNPTSDSLRTSVTQDTRSLWMVIFAPRSIETKELEDHVKVSRDLMARHLGGSEPVSTSGRILS